jgi:glycine oxidase
MPPQSPKVVVVGAGPIGLYTAMVLASAGCQVQLVDDGKRGAGWASGGMLGAAYEILGSQTFSDSFKTFALSSQRLWGKFLAAIGAHVVPRSIFVARNDDEASRLSDLAQTLALRDLTLTPCALPVALQGIQAWKSDSDTAFDPRHMLVLLRQECAKQGVSFVNGQATSVTSGRVLLGDNTALTADQIMVTTGFGGHGLVDSLPELASLAPVKGQMLALAGVTMDRNQVVRAGRIYLLPRAGRVIVGASSVEGDTQVDILDKDIHKVLFAEAKQLCPCLGRGQIVESWAGLRPMTPDGLPLLGYSEVPGVILATGAYRNGWLLAPAMAKAVMGLVLREDKVAANLQPYSPQRFPN